MSNGGFGGIHAKLLEALGARRASYRAAVPARCRCRSAVRSSG